MRGVSMPCGPLALSCFTVPVAQFAVPGKPSSRGFAMFASMQASFVPIVACALVAQFALAGMPWVGL